MFKHILHATDFSPAALRATNATRELAQRTGAKVTLLTPPDP